MTNTAFPEIAWLAIVEALESEDAAELRQRIESLPSPAGAAQVIKDAAARLLTKATTALDADAVRRASLAAIRRTLDELNPQETDMTDPTHPSPVAARQAEIIRDSAVCALSQLADVHRVIEEFTTLDSVAESEERDDLMRHLTRAREALRDLYRTAHEIADH